jgi:hypothetical protein
VVIESKDWYTDLGSGLRCGGFGMKSSNALAEQLAELIPDVYVVGDAYEVKNIKRANLTAYDYCCNI